jgi:hypothetical protein
MNNRRDFDQSNLDGAPTMAAPAAGQQQGGWPQQAPYGEPGPYPSPGQQLQDTYYGQQPPQYGQPAPAYEAPQVPLPVHRRPVPDMNPGDPENPTPDDLLCHPNPPGCTGDQKAPAQPAQ